jgi:hypothetical protein
MSRIEASLIEMPIFWALQAKAFSRTKAASRRRRGAAFGFKHFGRNDFFCSQQGCQIFTGAMYQNR